MTSSYLSLHINSNKGDNYDFNNLLFFSKFAIIATTISFFIIDVSFD